MWETFLKQAGAELSQTGITVFDPHRHAGDYGPDRNWLCSLDSWQALRIEGADSKTFLQGQLSCNLEQISASQALAGSLCTPKGRAVSNFYLVQQSDTELLFLLPRGSAQATLQTLGKYIVFSKAELSDASDRYTLFGLSGPTAASIIKERCGAGSDLRLASTLSADLQVLCVSDASRYLLVCPQHKAADLWTSLSAEATAANSDLWQLLDIHDGFGFVTSATVESFIPQMINLQSIGAISFSKGCYTGQEIVARAHYRGTLKRAMFRAECRSTHSFAAGTALLSDDDKARNIGDVVSSCQRDAQTVEVLAVVTRDDNGPRPATLESGPPLSYLELPYPPDTSTAD